MIYLKRVYEPPSTDDGLRILVERLWPRGLSKSRAQIDLWLKDIAPSPQLRTWYGHELTKWEEFQRRYRAELQNNSAVGQLQQLQQDKPIITFVYAARDTEHNSAWVLKAFLEEYPHS
jgi:uncharacterized protein YeaO (DUF488 family)